MGKIKDFIKKMPKAELHLHIEGTLEPELMFKMAKRNDVEIPYKCVKSLKQAYNFNNLQEFLDIYYQGAKVLKEEKDFYELTLDYLKKAKKQNIKHTEIFFDPQTHTLRGIEFEIVINGIKKALVTAKRDMGITSKIIMCFLRHLSEEDAFKTLEEALPYKKWITAVGLDSSEMGNPPSKFKRVFEKAIKEGFYTTAHAGEEGPPQYIWEALELLKVSRIDHGNRCMEDKKLIKELVQRRIPLTICPLSNVKLKVVKKINLHPIKKMMAKGLLVTVNSDDPAYFGGYVNENYLAIQKALSLTKEEIGTLGKNSFEASFLGEKDKMKRTKEVEKYCGKED
ncbi:adenosine deaminase [Candidatus Micrarchaeota archaeon]|nr:adenosine deaminase [Candidatus Micrarchaeota archaeon]